MKQNSTVHSTGKITTVIFFLLAVFLYSQYGTDLVWQPNTEPDLLGYRLHIGESSGSYNETIDLGNITKFQVDWLQPGGHYYMVITAYDIYYNESVHSDEVYAQAQGINLVPNGSFEEGQGIIPDGWQVGSGYYTRTDQDAAEGNWSLRYEHTGKSATTIMTVPLTPGTAYTLTVSMKVLPGASGSIYFDTWDRYDSEYDCQFTLDNGQAGSWKTFTSDFNSGSFSDVRLRCFQNSDWNGTGYFDNIQIRAAGPLPTPTPSPTPNDQEGLYPAEDMSTASGCSIASNNAGYHGSGFVDIGGDATWFELNGVMGNGLEADLSIRYALKEGSRPCVLSLNGGDPVTVDVPFTGSWTTWAIYDMKITLVDGPNTLRMTAGGGGGPNVDEFLVTLSGSTPTPTPTAQPTPPPTPEPTPTPNSTPPPTPTAQPTPTGSLPQPGDIITLTAVNGNYISADNGGNILIANKTTAGLYEKFEVMTSTRGTGNIGLKCLGNNQIICAEKAGANPLYANRPRVGGWESFTMVEKNGKIGLLAFANNMYVCAESGGNDPLIANRAQMRSYESFTWTLAD